MQSETRGEGSLMEIYARERWGGGRVQLVPWRAPPLQSRAGDKPPLTDTHTDGLKVQAQPNQRESVEWDAGAVKWSWQSKKKPSLLVSLLIQRRELQSATSCYIGNLVQTQTLAQRENVQRCTCWFFGNTSSETFILNSSSPGSKVHIPVESPRTSFLLLPCFVNDGWLWGENVCAFIRTKRQRRCWLWRAHQLLNVV